MKTFREYYGDTVNPYYHSYAGSLLGPGLGQYIPIADLNAQRQLLGPKKENGHDKEITKSDLDQIEKYADRVFGALDIDVEFTRHFLDRVNDVRNQRQITSAELTRLFKQSYKKFGKTIRKLGPDAEAVISDMRTDINMPFVLNLKGGELELVAKTVMRKKNFKTTNPKLAFEDFTHYPAQVDPKKDALKGDFVRGDPSKPITFTGDIEKDIENANREVERERGHKQEPFITEQRAKKAVAGGKVQKLVTAHGLTYKGKKYKEIDMELVSIDNSSQIVTFNIIHPREIFGNEVKLTFRNLRRGPYMATDTSKINESRGYFTRAKSPKSKGKSLLKVMKSDLEQKLKGIPHSLSPDKTGNRIIIKVKSSDVDKTKKLVGLPNITQVVSEGRKTIKVGEDALLGDGSPHYALVSHREVIATGTKQEMLELSDTQRGRVWLTKSNVGDIVEESNPRIPRKKGQPAGSDKHSDLYTDENPRGTIHGLGFKDVATAKASVKKIEGSGKTHAHKIQAAIAMEQRAKVMGKKAEAAVYRAYIEKMKKKTKEMQNEDMHGFKCPPDYRFDKKLMACVPKKGRYKDMYVFPHFFGKSSSSGGNGDQTQNGQSGNGNGQSGNGNGGNGNGGGNGGGNGNGGNGGGNGNGP